MISDHIKTQIHWCMHLNLSFFFFYQCTAYQYFFVITTRQHLLGNQFFVRTVSHFIYVTPKLLICYLNRPDLEHVYVFLKINFFSQKKLEIGSESLLFAHHNFMKIIKPGGLKIWFTFNFVNVFKTFLSMNYCKICKDNF